MNRKYLTKVQTAAGCNFPSYTTKELKSHLRNELTAEKRTKIEAEIKSRNDKLTAFKR